MIENHSYSFFLLKKRLNDFMERFLTMFKGFGSAFFFADPDPGKYLHADPDPDPGGKGKK